MQLAPGEVRRKCADCGKLGVASSNPHRSDFSPHRRDAEGNVVKFYAYCRECNARRVREAWRANREESARKQRESRAKRMEEVRADPERLLRYREDLRMRSHLRRRAKGAQRNGRLDPEVERSLASTERVPIGPFRDWILELREQLKREWAFREDDPDRGRHLAPVNVILAERLAMDPRFLRRIVSGVQENISVRVLDRAVTHEGSRHLDDFLS